MVNLFTGLGSKKVETKNPIYQIKQDSGDLFTKAINEAFEEEILKLDDKTGIPTKENLEKAIRIKLEEIYKGLKHKDLLIESYFSKIFTADFGKLSKDQNSTLILLKGVPNFVNQMNVILAEIGRRKFGIGSGNTAIDRPITDVTSEVVKRIFKIEKADEQQIAHYKDFVKQVYEKFPFIFVNIEIAQKAGLIEKIADFAKENENLDLDKFLEKNEKK